MKQEWSGNETRCRQYWDASQRKERETVIEIGATTINRIDSDWESTSSFKKIGEKYLFVHGEGKWSGGRFFNILLWQQLGAWGCAVAVTAKTIEVGIDMNRRVKREFSPKRLIMRPC